MTNSKSLFTKSSIFAITALLTLGIAPAAFAATNVVVSPGNMNGWSFLLTDVNGAVSTDGTGAMVTGPGTPPAGIGSANIATVAANSQGAAAIETSNFDGVRLDAITTLSYCTYVTANNGQQFPYLTLFVSTGLSNPTQDVLYFEPPYQTPTTGNPSLPDQGATAMNTWQCWNALEGGWWDASGTGTPGTGVAPLSAILALYPGASIISVTPTTNTFWNGPLDGAAVAMGYTSQGLANGNVDNFSFGTSSGTTTYNFEPSSGAAVPQFGVPAALVAAIGLLGMVLLRKRGLPTPRQAV